MTRARNRFATPLVLALLLAGAGCAPRAQAPAPPPVVEGFLDAGDGTRLHYRKVGDGPGAVILPAELFLHPAFDRLAPGRTLYYYDMRNRGLSDSVGPERANSIQQDVLDLEAVRAHFGLDSVDVVGFSYLGLMVAMYAKDHPERVRRIVQLGPIARRLDTEFPEGLRAGDYLAAMDTTKLAELRRLKAEGWPASRPQEYCRLEGEVTRVALVGNPANLARLNSNICEKPNEWPLHLARHFARHFTSVQELKLDRGEFENLPMPVLTIHGTLDRNAAYGGGREWAMTFPNARLVTVEGAAHCAWADDPDRVFGAIDEFLRGNWPAGSEQVTALERPAAR